MANMEIRVRLASEANAMRFAEIPFRREVIDGVLALIEDIGGNISGRDISEMPSSYQLSDDGETVFYEVIFDDGNI